jgi:predicted RND superfamily exporter protein
MRVGLAGAVLLVTLLMALGLRSLRLGIWAMVPNLLPLLIAAGLAGLIRSRMQVDVLLLGMLAVGMAVDDTSRLLGRLRIEARVAPLPEALARAFGFSGRPLTMTTVALVVGLLPLAASDYQPLRLVGLLLPLGLGLALLHDLLLTPALVVLGPLAPPRPPAAAP